MHEKIIAQCFMCHAQQELPSKPDTAPECNECGGRTSVYTSRKLSPEELAKYGSVNQTRKKPTVKSRLQRTDVRARQAKIKEEMEEKQVSEKLKDGQEVKPFIPDKIEFLKQIAKGKSVSKAGVAVGIPKGSIAYWTDKWGLKGIKPEQAQLMLDEMAIDGKPHQPENQENGKTQDVIDRLREELSKAIGERNAAQDRIKELEQRLNNVIAERNNAQTRANTLEKQMYDAVQSRDLAMDRVAELEKELAASLDTIDRTVNTHHDPVNHPSHYTAGKVECIDAIESATIGLSGGRAYATGAAIKYLWRWSRKNGLEDLQKAAWYVNRLIKMVEEDSNDTADQEGA